MLKEKNVFTVTSLANEIKKTLENKISTIYIRGEVNGVVHHSSGHIYFNLKDSLSNIHCICWRSNSSKNKSLITEGNNIICNAELTCYPPRSRYQLIIKTVFVEGVGDYFKNLEILKSKLLKEGLFNDEKKKALPRYPSKICLVTSENGAALHDVQQRLTTRVECEVFFIDTKVQGIQASEEIVKNLQLAELFNPDIIILTRGGGSIEDLEVFNNEEVVRAVAKSNIPIVTAIGHETDTMIVDYASDFRAPTPTASIEIVLPSKEETIKYINNLSSRVKIAFLNKIKVLSDKLKLIVSQIIRSIKTIEFYRYKVIDLSERIYSCIKRFFESQKFKLRRITFTFGLIERKREFLAYQIKSLDLFKQNYFAKQKSLILNFASNLKNLSYRSALTRGYAIVRKDKEIITTKKSLKQNEKIQIELQDGFIEGQVLSD